MTFCLRGYCLGGLCLGVFVRGRRMSGYRGELPHEGARRETTARHSGIALHISWFSAIGRECRTSFRADCFRDITVTAMAWSPQFHTVRSHALRAVPSSS